MERRLTALVTGANKGIGFSVVTQLLKKGYAVYLGARDADKGAQAVEKLKAMGYAHVTLVPLDVTQDQSVIRAAAWLAGKEDILDVLINNAGIGGEQPQRSSSANIPVLKEVFETNFTGAVRVTASFLPMMRRSEQPRIVNVSSELGSIVFQSDSSSDFYATQLMAYSASKAALNAFTVMLAKELQDSTFKINGVSPGYTATDLTRYAGGKTADEAARIIVKYATLDAKGPSGGFFGQNGSIPW
jgi:NAD(P)-dependent dehydrogenase (short-subunit alcohol dehydrogenase family)